MAGPSQPKVTNEIWNDDRVKSFLLMEPYGSENADFHVLLKAYRGMRPNDFSLSGENLKLTKNVKLSDNIEQIL